MSSKNFIYTLRCTIQPGHHEEQRIRDLISFCKQAQIDDVAFFINVEELNQGHLTIEETKPWIDLILRCKERLEPLSVTTSINPWTTLLHTDRGRILKPGQNFRLMVDPYGNEASATVCPLCPEWRSYIAEMYAYYAEVKPYILWVEDDIRLHNHDPLKWGGCFCDAHMEMFSKEAGKKLTREEFVKGLLAPGKPHPYRKIWLDTMGRSMKEVAEIIGVAVHEVSPGTRVGLMSSSPDVHCAEGRDWEGMLKGLASGTPFVNRPNLPAYAETTSHGYLWNFSTRSRMAVGMLPAATEIYPELESVPNTRFSKSGAFTRFQIETSLALGASGIMLNIFDMMGNGVMLSEGYQGFLAGCKPFVSAVRQLGLDTGKLEGVKVLIDSSSSATLVTDKGESLRELFPREGFWAGLLSAFGIPVAYTVEKSHTGSIIAVSGQYFKNLNADEIKSLFANNFIIMEGEAAFTLLDMGLGHLAGIKSAVWMEQDAGVQAYEQVCNGKAYCGLEEARLSLQYSAGKFLNIEYGGEAYILTAAKDPYGETVGNGMALYDKRVLILPFGHFNGNVQKHLNTVRQEIIQEIIKEVGKEACPVFVEGAPYILPCMYDLGGKRALMLTNFSSDGLEKVRIYAPAVDAEKVMVMSQCKPDLGRANITRDGECIVLKDGLERLETKVILWT